MKKLSEIKNGAIICVTTGVSFSGLILWIGIKSFPGLNDPIYYFLHICSGFSMGVLIGLFLCMSISLWKMK